MQRYSATVNGVLITASTRAELLRKIAEFCQR